MAKGTIKWFRSDPDDEGAPGRWAWLYGALHQTRGAPESAEGAPAPQAPEMRIDPTIVQDVVHGHNGDNPDRQVWR
jgi:hypothetical protein